MSTVSCSLGVKKKLPIPNLIFHQAPSQSWPPVLPAARLPPLVQLCHFQGPSSLSLSLPPLIIGGGGGHTIRVTGRSYFKALEYDKYDISDDEVLEKGNV